MISRWFIDDFHHRWWSSCLQLWSAVRVWSDDHRWSSMIWDHRWRVIDDHRAATMIIEDRSSTALMQRWFTPSGIWSSCHHRSNPSSMIIDDTTLNQSDDHRWNFHLSRIDDSSMIHRWRKKCKLKIYFNNRNKNLKLLLDVQVVKGSLIIDVIDDQCVSTMIIDYHRRSSMINADEKDFHELQIMNNIFTSHALLSGSTQFRCSLHKPSNSNP